MSPAISNVDTRLMIHIYELQGEDDETSPYSPILIPHLHSGKRKYLEYRNKKLKDFNHLAIRPIRQPFFIFG